MRKIIFIINIFVWQFSYNLYSQYDCLDLYEDFSISIDNINHSSIFLSNFQKDTSNFSVLFCDLQQNSGSTLKFITINTNIGSVYNVSNYSKKIKHNKLRKRKVENLTRKIIEIKNVKTTFPFYYRQACPYGHVSKVIFIKSGTQIITKFFYTDAAKLSIKENELSTKIFELVQLIEE